MAKVSGSAERRSATRFEMLDTLEQLLALESQWASLRSCYPSPTDRFAWTLSCLETIRGGGRPAILCAFSGDRLEAAAPLVRRRSLLCGYEQIGVRQLGEPADLLFRDDAALHALTRELGRRRLPVWLPRLPSDSATVPALVEAYGRRRLVLRRASRSCPVLDLGGAGAEPQSVLSKRMRSDLRRAERRARDMGEVRFEVLSPASREEFAQAFRDAQRVEMAGWKGREQTALGDDPPVRAFFAAYGARASESGTLRVAFMRIDGVAVAMQLAVEDHDRYWLLKIGYDEAFSRCSPGQLMMLHSLEYAARTGLRAVEFLGSEAPWTKRWTATERAMTSLAVYPATPHGIGALVGDVGPQLVRALIARGAAQASRGRALVARHVGGGPPKGAGAGGR